MTKQGSTLIDHLLLVQNSSPNVPKPILTKAFSISLFLDVFQLAFFFYGSSLLLLSAGMAQVVLSISLFSQFPVNRRKKNTGEQKMATVLLSGFLVLLMAGLLFFETYSRFQSVRSVASYHSLIVLLISLSINLILIKRLARLGLTQLLLGNFAIPFKVIPLLFGLMLAGSLLAPLTRISNLDTFISLCVGTPIFLWVSFVVVDAYYILTECTVRSKEARI